MLARVMAVGLWMSGAAVVTAEDKVPQKPDTPVATADAGTEFKALHEAYVAKFQPLWLASSRAWWDANISGADADFERKSKADMALVDLHSDRVTFAKLKALRDSGKLTDPQQKRLADVMYRSFLPAQGDPALLKRIVALENKVEQIFNLHRSPVQGRELTENEVRAILSGSSSSAEAEAAWKGYMAVGAKVDPPLRELVKLRNELAGQLGYPNYYALRLAIDEVDQKELFRIFDELDELTQAPFAQLKQRIDQARATKFGIAAADLRPWHFGDLFFQEAPDLEEVNLDDVFRDKDLLALARKYFTGLECPVEDILEHSDLYEKPGKSPHAFCHDLDRAGDVRVLCNLTPNLQWADTLQHELGHGIYDKYISRDLPFLLHEAAHGITTEGVALMLGSMVLQEEWLTKVAGLEAQEAARVVRSARNTLRSAKIIFSRWAQVMVRFELEMYANPEQDLGKVWWDLKQRYQLLNPPETTGRPDYGAKNHIVTTPVYYHNYMLGELFASQVQQHIANRVLHVEDPQQTAFVGRADVGRYLREQIFAPGKQYKWNDLTERVTGEPLTAKYFARQYLRPVAGEPASR